MKIGYVGLGAMGGALARWLVADHELTVWDKNPAATERFTAQGGKAADSLAELARQSDFIFLCLPRSTDVGEAIFSEGGLIDGLSAGKIVVDQTSGIAVETRGFADRLAAKGVVMLDAPVAGGVPNATAGTITIMASGPDEAIERVMPAFKAMTSKIYRASDQAGDAQSVKTMNNMMNMVFRIATLEFAALAVKLGVPLDDLTEALNAGIAGNFTCRTVLRAIVEGRSTGDFALTLMLKDNNQALALGMTAGVPMPLSALARGVLQQNINFIGPMANLDDVIVFMEKVTGISFTGKTENEAIAKADIDRITSLVITALAACNRATVHEIMSLAAKMGMALEDFGRIVNNGSAWSRECETILAELKGSGPNQTRTIGEVVEALQDLERLNTSLGVATVMMGEVRAVFETVMREHGPEATVDALASVGFG